MIEVQKLKKRYSREIILDVASLHFAPGIHITHGRNGAGKSTFLKILAGYIPFTGEIVLNGEIQLQKDFVKHRQFVNFSEAEPIFPPYLKGWDLVEMFKDLKKGTEAQVKEFADAFGMKSFLGQQVGGYSSGMLKKLSLMLAFLGTPGIILLDEPFTTIDKESQQILVEWIREKKKSGITFLISTHHEFGAGYKEEATHWQVQDKTIQKIEVAQLQPSAE